MSALFLQVVTGLTIPEEGGDKFTDFADDPGGATKYGITLATLRDWRGDQTLQPVDVQNLALVEAQAIYAVKYWMQTGCDLLDPPVAVMVFDFGVGSGAGTSARMLQEVAGFTGSDVDGWVGEETVAALTAIPYPTVVSALHSRQLTFVDAIKNSAAQSDRAGWENRVNARYAFAQTLIPKKGATS